MRICVLTDAYPAVTETFIYEPVRWLREAGHRVSVIAARRRPSAEPEPVPGLAEGPSRVTAMSRSERLAILAGAPFEVAVSACRALRIRLPSWRWVPEVALRASLPEVRRADCLLAHFGVVGARWLPVAAVAGRPLLVYFHGYDVNRVLTLAPRTYDALFASGAGLLTNSRAMKAKLAAAGAPAERVRIVRLAATPELDATPPCPAVGPRSILTVARLLRNKGVDDALAAFARARFAGAAEWRYEVVGDGPLRAELAAAAASAGIADRVAFRGFLARAETLEALRRASIFILSSKTLPEGDAEGTPVSIIEAAWLGLPVVSTRTGGIPEVLPPDAGKEGFLVDAGDVAGLARALERLAASDRARRDWGDACRAHARANHAAAGHVAELVDAMAHDARIPAIGRAPVPMPFASTLAAAVAGAGPPVLD